MYLLKHLNLNTVTSAHSVLKIEAPLLGDFSRNKQNYMPKERCISPASVGLKQVDFWAVF